MAFDLNGTTQWATIPSAAANFNVGTFVGWFAPDIAPGSASLLSLWDTDTARYIAYKNASVNQMRIYCDGRETVYTTTGLWTAGTFAHFAMGYNKTGNVQTLWINGTSVSVAVAGAGTWGANTFGTNLYVGRNAPSNSFFDGDVAEFATYTVVLADADVAQLARGYSPLLVRPDKLMNYTPFIANGTPGFGTGLATLVASPTQTAHPRVFMPHRRMQRGVAAAGSTITTANLPGGVGYMGSGQTRAIQPAGVSYMG